MFGKWKQIEFSISQFSIPQQTSDQYVSRTQGFGRPKHPQAQEDTQLTEIKVQI